MIHIHSGYPDDPGTAGQGFARRRLVQAAVWGLFMPTVGGLLSACSVGRSGAPPTVEDRSGRSGTGRAPDDRAGGAGERAPASTAAQPQRLAIGHRVRRAGSVWVQGQWDDLPGWGQDRSAQALAALLPGCARAGSVWAQACQAARRIDAADDAATYAWMREHLRPWRIEEPDGRAEGLLTGYYEPHFEARRTPDAEFRAAIHAPPADLAQRQPYWTRQQLETLPRAQAALAGRALAYLRDPLDVLVMQIQGSGRLTLREPDGRRREVRMAFAAHNGHPYASVGRWLIEQGHLKPSQATWPGIRDWLQRHPARAPDVLRVNPRVVFFREEALQDPNLGPRGAMGIALTPQRSIAVDPRSIPYGTPVWMESRDPAGTHALRRLVVAQDTGSAITGAVRADYFWGWGEEAGQRAGTMRQPLRMWALWPAGQEPPA